MSGVRRKALERFLGRRIAPSFAVLLLTASLLLGACRKSSAAPAQPFAPASATVLDPPATMPAAPRINTPRAWEYVKEFVAIGKRPLNSPGHQQAEQYITQKLQSAGVSVERDAFQGDTAAGRFPIANLIGKIPGRKDGIIVLAGHYDTNYPLRDTSYVGANDGGSTTGLLLELAQTLQATTHGGKLDGCSVWFVFTDAEEAMVDWTDADSVYGAKHLAAQWKADGTAARIHALILLDMIGDADLNVDRETGYSTPWLQQTVYRAAQRLQLETYFYGRDAGIEDDHKPFAAAGIPVVDLIDLDYGPANVYHHTTQDTLDKLSPKSLEIVGNTVLETLRAINTR